MVSVYTAILPFVFSHDVSCLTLCLLSSLLCFATVDEAGKMVSDDGTEVTVEGAVEDQEVEKDEDGQEVIKVYIFKADSGEDDMGKSYNHFLRRHADWNFLCMLCVRVFYWLPKLSPEVCAVMFMLCCVMLVRFV